MIPTADAARGALRSAARAVGALVFPEPCLGCGAPRPGDAGVCAGCLQRLPRADRRAVAAELAAMGAPAPLAARAVALWRYDDGGTVQRVQHALKYRGRPSLGVPLGRLLGSALATALPAWRPDVVLAVPLSRVRELERGYNQSAGLARGCAEALGAPLAPLLTRTRATQSQARLSSAARRANVEGAFGLAPEAEHAPLAGRRVLLVGDVLTTGATLLAAARPLQAVGAEVGLAALAYANS